jgi:hypothetical protein
VGSDRRALLGASRAISMLLLRPVTTGVLLVTRGNRMNAGKMKTDKENKSARV